tara:strand:- start:69 stop:695 length:627 start_codon:yes stop_codon:yes gene_type:complete
LENKELDKIDLTIFDKYISPKLRNVSAYNFYGNSGKEHYKLLAYLSTCYNNETLIDIGTHMGGSAFALSYNQSNKVISVDVTCLLSVVVDLPNIEFKYLDKIENSDKDEDEYETLDPDIIHSSRFILYDTRHDGKLEAELHNYLMESNWTGICMYDDIKYRYTREDNKPMQEFWNSIDENQKIDVTDYGHWTGTGLVWYGDKPTINLR